MTYATAHIADFASLRAACDWRLRLERSRERVPGLRWVKAMAPIGSAGSGGFSVGGPRLRRQLTVASWECEEAFEEFDARSPLAEAWRTGCSHAWHVLMTPYRTQGTFRGPCRFEAEGGAPADEPIAVLTLGRSSWRGSVRFSVEGARLSESILNSNGLGTAMSAGLPPFGNATFSLWQRQRDMIEFAHARGSAHAATARKGILEEQIAVRFRVHEVRGAWDAATTPCAPELERLVAGLARQRTPALV